MNFIKSKNKEEDKIEFWTKNPYILFEKNKFLDVIINSSMNLEEKLNALTRLTLYLTLFFYLIFKDLKIIISGLCILVIIIFIYYVFDKKKTIVKETFSDKNIYDKFKSSYTNPQIKNPLMNVLLPEINDNPYRLQAAPSYNTAVVDEINTNTQNFISDNFKDPSIKDKLFKDLGDKFQFEQSMRQFYTTPNTLVPNNQKDFANFCYGNMASCKDGNVENCYQNNYRHILH